MVEFCALWDTGATNSVISQDVVDACGLISTGIQKVHHAYGDEENVETFLVNIELPTAVEFPGLQVTKGKLTGADMLIGMDIINSGDFAVTHPDGKTKFSFRIPSQANIDFVAETNRANLLSRQSTPSQQTRERNRRKRKRKP